MRKIKTPSYLTILLIMLLTKIGFGQCPAMGDIIISEIMQNPNAVNDSNGEWFELYNTSGSVIDIEGWEISDAGSNSHIISNNAPLNIQAGSYLVLGKNGDMTTNGGVIIDYEYSGITLGNSDDEIILTCDPNGIPIEIDRVEYDGGPDFPDPNGASMCLDPTKLNSLDNDTGSHWCASISPFGLGDLGTPGNPNDICLLPELSINDVIGNEGNSGTTIFTFTASINTTLNNALTFNVSTMDGSASVSDNDYVGLDSVPVTIIAGELTTTIDIIINGDIIDEVDESFTIELSNVPSGVSILDGSGTATIINDDTTCPSMWILGGTVNGTADYETSGSIISDQIIESAATVDYDAASEIILNPSFEVKAGSVFEAFIDGCNNGGGGSN
ncbi:MAG: lamin tail domain-containing protein [Saprospiraceae bacterium]|nr:lamin tail domain-containing protein [Saprospiraceae bacterium]